jgi:hypothetical protein
VAKSLKDIGLYQLADGIFNVYKTGKWLYNNIFIVRAAHH